MYRLLSIFMLALLGIAQAVAQEYEYVPFVREGVKWIYCINNEDDIYPVNPLLSEAKYYQTLEINGSITINGKAYKAMHKYWGNAIDWAHDTIPIYLREEDKIVYGIIPDSKRYIDCPINTFSIVNAYSGQEFIVYDFNNTAGYLDEILNPDGIPPFFEYLRADTIIAGNHKVKCHRCLFAGNEFNYIEGIGMDAVANGYTLCFFMGQSIGGGSALFHLSHVVENGEIIYKGRWYEADNHVGINEVVAEQPQRVVDGNYYNLMGQPVGKELPQTPGIYIHNGRKIVVR